MLIPFGKAFLNTRNWKIKKGKFNASKKGMEVIEIVIAFGQISKGI